MFRIIYPALRWLGWAVVLLYVVLALAVLGTRYVLFPNAGHYKTHIEAQLSALLDGRVELGSIQTGWQHLNPRIEISQLVLHDGQGARVLAVPHLTTVVSWRSLLAGTPQFVSVHAGGVDLTVRHDDQGQLWLLGRSIAGDHDLHQRNRDDASSLGTRAVDWLVSQPQIRLYDSTLRWVDEARGAEPLLLQDVNLKIRNQGRQHQFSLAARPDANVGGSFDMRGNFVRSADSSRPLALETGRGQLYVHIEDMQPQAWQPWVDWPDFMGSDRVAVRTWMEVGHGEPLTVTTDVRVRNARWFGTDTHAVQSGRARLHVSGPWHAFQDVVLRDHGLTAGRSDTQAYGPVRFAGVPDVPVTDTVDFSLQAHDLQISLPGVYAEPVVISTIGLGGHAVPSHDGVAVQLGNIALHNDDIALTGQLSWNPGTGVGPGQLDTRLQVSRARLDAVHRYMPQGVSQDVTQWLEQGLLAGQVHDAEVVVRGDLARFPFDEPDSDGEFHIRGDFQDAVIDYAPHTTEEVGWPHLDDVQGRIELDRTRLRIHAESAQINPADTGPVSLHDINAEIDDLQNDPILSVSGQTQGDGAAYLAFLHQSALSRILNHAFDQTMVQGDWSLPLALTIPLSRARDTTVDGTIRIADGSIRFDPDVPPFERVRGNISFTDTDVVIPALSARFLNDEVQLSGGVGPGHPGLRMSGHVGSDALKAMADLPGMERFQGRTAYVATLTGLYGGSDGGYPTLAVTSDLQGMELDFPPPLNKAADESWPLQLGWEHRDGAGARVLDVSLNGSMHGHFIRHGNQSGRYFDAGSLGVGRTAELPETGLNVDIEHPVFNGDDWDAITREFTGTDDNGQEPVFPELRNLRVQTEHGQLLGLDMDMMTYTVRRAAADEWRIDISSTQTAGTLTWTEENGTISGPVKAVFHRLAYGGEPAPDDTGVSPGDADAGLGGRDVGDDLSIPAINLIVENMRLYGRDIGKLAIVGAVEDNGNSWRLEHITLSSPSAHLEGRGKWRLRGPQRGLTLDAEVDVSDLGDYFDQIGFEDVLSAGAGTASMQIDWHDLPWSFDVNKIDGELNFEFTKGRLSTLNSRSARLLELVSLQSVRRLATLDLNPLTLTKDGFPYDLLRGALRLEHGRVYTEDYRIVGPVGTIVLDGLVHLNTGKLDLQAVVIPNLDVSGAAIAAGVAINPVVGIGAFLTQWLLKAPLAAAMTAQYKIDGDWDQPEIQAVERIRGQADGASAKP